MALPALGLTLPQFAAGPGPAFAAADDAARLGYAGVFLFDHLWPLGGPRTAPALECWTLLGALAARLGRHPGGPRLGTLVTRAGLRPPVLVARMAATAGQAAGAPLIVGAGGGDRLNRDENLAFGLPYPDQAGRARAVVQLLTALTGPEAGDPPPVTWSGGTGPTARALAGAHADAWNVWAATPAEVAAGLAEVRRAAEAAGRDPDAAGATWGGQVLVDEDGDRARARLAAWGSGRDPGEVARVLAGDPVAVLAALAGLAAAGAGWCVLSLVGGGADRARSLLAEAAGLSGCHLFGDQD